MAIVKDLSRNTYYINYKFKLPNGKWQNVNIKNNVSDTLVLELYVIAKRIIMAAKMRPILYGEYLTAPHPAITRSSKNATIITI